MNKQSVPICWEHLNPLPCSTCSRRGATRIRRVLLPLAFALAVVALVLGLTGCVPAAQLVDPASLVQQLREQPLSASQARQALCSAPYREVVAELGKQALRTPTGKECIRKNAA